MRCPKCGNDYYYPVKDRRVGDNTCTICSNGEIIEVIEGINDLKTTDPLLAEEWSNKNSLKPNMVSKRMKRYSIWNCPNCKQEYGYLLNKRLLDDCVCPICNGQKLIVSINDLESQYPILSREISVNNKLRANEININWNIDITWLCDNCKYEYNENLRKRIENKNTCPVCSGNIVITGKNDLLTLAPLLAKEYSDNNKIISNKIYRYSFKPVKWKCPTCKGEYEYPVKLREVNDKNCPYCNFKKLLVGFNDLKTLEPELAKEFSPNNKLKPEKILRNYNGSLLWICPICKFEYEYPVNQRQFGDKKCPCCYGNIVIKGVNDLVTTDPLLAKEYSKYNTLQSDQIKKSLKEKYLWTCPKCNLDYEYDISKRKLGDKSCPYCNEGRLLPGFNSFDVKFPKLMEELLKIENILLGVNPGIESINSTRKVYWKCNECEYKYLMSFKDRRIKDKRNQNPCPRCNGRRNIRFHFINI